MYKINRKQLIETIRKSILNNRITNIYGLPGVGKTTVCSECIKTYFCDKKIKVIDMVEDTFFNNAVLHISDYDDVNEYDICIIEDFYDVGTYHQVFVVLEFIAIKTKFVIVSREKINYDNAVNSIVITCFTEQEIMQCLMKNLQNYEFMDISLIKEIILTTKGNPLLINNIISLLNKDAEIYKDKADLIYKSCIVDSNGKPIDKTDNSIKIVVTEVNEKLLYELSQNPNLLYNLSSYDFERVIAKMFEKKGFTVKITQQTRDGGKDIFIAKNDLLSFLFYVECKKYAPNQHVGIDVIQRLYGVISAEKATGGIIATTSYFTKPAKDYIQEHQLEHQLTLQDYNTISDILKSL